MKYKIVDAVDGDDVSAHHLNAHHQAVAFYELFIDKRYEEAAVMAKELEVSAKQLTRASYKYLAYQNLERCQTTASPETAGAETSVAGDSVTDEDGSPLTKAANLIVSKMQEE